MIPSPNTAGSRRPRSPSMSLAFRRRRIIWLTIILSTFILYILTPSTIWAHSPVHDLNTDLDDADTALDFSRIQAPGPVIPINIDIPLPESAEEDEVDEDQVDDNEEEPEEDDVEMPRPGKSVGNSELQNLLHMVSTSELLIPKDVDPSKPLDPSVYGADLNVGASWFKAPDADPPVIVFSKTTCPYSKKAKELLQTLSLSPAPKIIEVDRRGDTERLKTILTRLTGRSTFPNVFLNGQSLGGSDELYAMMEEGTLIRVFESGNVRVNFDVEAR